MRIGSADSDPRFLLVTAAHHFLLAALPIRHPASHEALTTFIDIAANCKLTTAELDAVFVRILSAIEPHVGGRMPCLIERYLSQSHASYSLGNREDTLKRFGICIKDAIRYRGVGSRLVQEAIAIIETNYQDPRLRRLSVAEELGISAAELSTSFKTGTGLTFVEYVRSVRLSRAGGLLATTLKSIKEIWVEVGYNHASNFDHDFKAFFASTPRQYRARALGDALHEPERFQPRNWSTEAVMASGKVLIIDDDPATRDSLGRYLVLEGFEVFTAPSGSEGLLEMKRSQPEAVLLDYHLPDTDALEWLQLVRRQSPPTFPAVIVFTADWAIESFEAEFKRLGAALASKLCEASDISRLLGSLCYATRYIASREC